MTLLQKLIMELIGLDPDAYRPVDTTHRLNSIRDMTDAQIEAVGNELNNQIDNGGPLYCYLVRSGKIYPHEFIIELMRGYRRHEK